MVKKIKLSKSKRGNVTDTPPNGVLDMSGVVGLPVQKVPGSDVMLVGAFPHLGHIRGTPRHTVIIDDPWFKHTNFQKVYDLGQPYTGAVVDAWAKIPFNSPVSLQDVLRAVDELPDYPEPIPLTIPGDLWRKFVREHQFDDDTVFRGPVPKNVQDARRNSASRLLALSQKVARTGK